MPIEVRELQIRSRVDSSARSSSMPGTAEELSPIGERQFERLRESVLAECRALLAAALRERQER
jgi:hypothetical protein